jgi:hypothetical protein
MSQARVLSSDEVQQLRDELAQGNSPTVWFTAEAVGVPEGRSGKVIALDEPAEGDFVQVRPASSKDTLSFSASEVTLVKPPRKRKSAPETTEAAPAKKEQPAASTARTSSANKQTGSGQTQAGPAQQKSTSQPSPRTTSTGGTRRKQPQISGATVTLSADQEGQWHVEVNTGKKRALKPTQVTPAAVAQAAKALHDDVADAVEPLLQAARERQRARVEELQRELAEAQRALEEMTD